MKSSSKVVKSFFDFRLNKYIILTNANLLNDQSNISLLILEEEAIDGVVEIKKTTCRFYNSHCKKLAPN